MADQVTTNARSMVERLFDPKVQDNVTKRGRALVAAIGEAKTRGMKVLGIVGRDGGYTKKAGDVVVVIPTVAESRVTPHAAAFQAVVWHCLVSHPKLQQNATKW